MHGAALQARLGAVHTVQPVIGGDAKVFSIAAASVVAKVARDAIMRRAGAAWPGYGLAEHKGYGTSAHFAALGRLGASPFHRLTFAPLKGMLPLEAAAARGAPLLAAEPPAVKAKAKARGKGKRGGAAAGAAPLAPPAAAAVAAPRAAKANRKGAAARPETAAAAKVKHERAEADEAAPPRKRRAAARGGGD